MDGDFPSAFHTAAPDSHVPSIWHSMQQQLSESQPQMPSKPSHPSPFATLPKRQVQSHLEMRLFLAATNCVVGGCDVTEACKPAREAHNFSKPYLCREMIQDARPTDSTSKPFIIMKNATARTCRAQTSKIQRDIPDSGCAALLMNGVPDLQWIQTEKFKQGTTSRQQAGI